MVKKRRTKTSRNATIASLLGEQIAVFYKITLPHMPGLVRSIILFVTYMTTSASIAKFQASAMRLELLSRLIYGRSRCNSYRLHLVTSLSPVALLALSTHVFVVKGSNSNTSEATDC